MPDLIEKFESRSLEGVLIIDAHMHLGKPYNFFSSAHDTQSLIRSMDLNCIALGCISSYDSIGQDAVKGNDEIKELVKNYPGRFLGQFGVNPNYPEQVDCILEDVEKSAVFTQAKLHPGFHEYSITGRQYRKVYELADKYSYPVLIHTWGKSDISQIAEIAGEYKRAKIIVGHSGGTLDGIKEAVTLAGKTKNTYLDLTLSYNYQGLIEWMVKEADSERLVFGSDTTFNSQSAALGKIIYADISDGDKLKILGENMKKLMEQCDKRREE